ncbi:ATP-binding cassette domain-containing protein [Catellatospora tritici]|uniref:ATP-binding cassette domain-containing protein n=1 Tax=Catellatospora tritici TaxID=2851566 RepID=UPI001C2CE02F|nr:ATP-binding cassette domain-containing protein [Catellatospora tritici]MBV1851546.1 ABC transporter ATP-binding protein [Catellatospora tritici]
MATEAATPLDQPDEDRPLLRARGLGLRTRRGWVFRELDLAVRPGELVALTGPAGGGRTSALLALGDRFQTGTGSREAFGRTAFALVPGVNDPDPALTVAEHLTERRRLLGHRRPRGVHRPTPTQVARQPGERVAKIRPIARQLGPATAGRAEGAWAEDGRLVRDLAPVERHRLMLALALLEEPDVLLVDDIDVGLTPAESAELLSDFAATGRAVVAVARTLPALLPSLGAVTHVEVRQ